MSVTIQAKRGRRGCEGTQSLGARQPAPRLTRGADPREPTPHSGMLGVATKGTVQTQRNRKAGMAIGENVTASMKQRRRETFFYSRIPRF